MKRRIKRMKKEGKKGGKMEQERKEEEERRDDLEKQTYAFQCELAPRASFKK